MPPSSPRRAGLLPPEATTFWRNLLEGPSGPGCYLHPPFTKCTPFLFFCNSFSVMLRNFTNFVTILIFLPQGDEYLRVMYLLLFYLLKKSRKLKDGAKTPLFDFRHITEFHGLRKPASFWISETSRDFIYCMSSSNNPRTKLGYDIYHSKTS